MSDPVKDAIDALERIAAVGRVKWEELANAIAASEEEDEILMFLQEICDGEI